MPGLTTVIRYNTSLEFRSKIENYWTTCHPRKFSNFTNFESPLHLNMIKIINFLFIILYKKNMFEININT